MDQKSKSILSLQIEKNNPQKSCRVVNFPIGIMINTNRLSFLGTNGQIKLIPIWNILAQSPLYPSKIFL